MEWEPFEKCQLSNPSPQSLLFLHPALDLPEHFVAPYRAADLLQGARCIRSRLKKKFLF